MSNSRIHWYLQEGEAFFLPLEFCISNVFFFSNDVIRGRFHAKFPFFSSSAAFVGYLGQVFHQSFSVVEPKSKSKVFRSSKNMLEA